MPDIFGIAAGYARPCKILFELDTPQRFRARTARGRRPRCKGCCEAARCDVAWVSLSLHSCRRVETCAARNYLYKATSRNLVWSSLRCGPADHPGPMDQPGPTDQSSAFQVPSGQYKPTDQSSASKLY